MAADEELPAEERETLELVQTLVQSGDLHPLTARPRTGDAGPERARDALKILGALDPELPAQIALDTLIDRYVEDPGLAHRTRREIRGSDDPPSG